MSSNQHVQVFASKGENHLARLLPLLQEQKYIFEEAKAQFRAHKVSPEGRQQELVRWLMNLIPVLCRLLQTQGSAAKTSACHQRPAILRLTV